MRQSYVYCWRTVSDVCLFAVKCKEQNMKWQVKLNLKKVHIHACVAVPRKALEAHKNLATMVVFGEEIGILMVKGGGGPAFHCTLIYIIFL